MNDLTYCFSRSLDGLDSAAADELVRHGVSTSAAFLWPGPVGRARIMPEALGTFRFDEGGRWAFISPVFLGGAFTPICDLLAWRLDDPGQWWSTRYSGAVLGDDQLHHALYWQKPIAIRRSPLSCLQHRGRGIVVFDWKMTSPALRSLRGILAEDDLHAAEIYERLSTPIQPVPPLRVASRRDAE